MSDTTLAAEAPALIERRGHVMIITLNRPQARNAVNAEMCIRVGDALEDAEQDPDVRVVVLTGLKRQGLLRGSRPQSPRPR